VPGEIARRDLLLLTLLAALVYLPGLGARDVWNPDEARYAQVAREMRAAGSWALPRLNDEVYTQKPPLFFWAIAGASLLTGGVDETAARLPSAVGAVAACVLVFAIAHRLFGRRAAWLAALAFGTCYRVSWQSRFGQIDMLLTALVALSMWCFVRGYTEKRQGWYWGFFLVGGLATLTKGPAGFLPPLIAIVAFLLLSGERHEVGRLRIGRGLLVWAAVVFAWLVPAALAGGLEYVEHIAFKQTVGRYVDPWHHVRPWHHYLTTLPVDFFPWSLLLPAAFAVRGDLSAAERRGARLAVCWAVVTVLFFSVSAAKRGVYVMTMLPALALLAGLALDRVAATWPSRRHWLIAPLGILAVGSAVAVAVAFEVAPTIPEVALLGGAPFVAAAAVAIGAFCAGAAAAFVFARRGRVGAAAGALAVGMTAMWLGVALYALPRFDVVKSARALSRELVARLGPDGAYGIYPHLDASFLFYTGRPAVPLDSAAARAEFFARAQPILVLAQRDDWGRLADRPDLVTLAADRDERNGYLLLARPQDLGPPAGGRLGGADAPAAALSPVSRAAR
jgi:4-amino-4-deoxy-L-arabinose transferase-like glycosyltransferase